jgi:hypothetical protein
MHSTVRFPAGPVQDVLPSSYVLAGAVLAITAGWLFAETAVAPAALSCLQLSESAVRYGSQSVSTLTLLAHVALMRDMHSMQLTNHAVLVMHY